MFHVQAICFVGFFLNTCRSVILSIRGMVRLVCTVQEHRQSVWLHRSGNCCLLLLLQEVLSQNTGICSYFLYALCEFCCFITHTENLGRGSASLLHNQCLWAQETKNKLSVEITLKHFGISGETLSSKLLQWYLKFICRHELWMEGLVEQSAVVHLYSSVGQVQVFCWVFFLKISIQYFLRYNTHGYKS